MKTIQRYKMTNTAGELAEWELLENPEGTLIQYDDHVATIAALQADLAAARAERDKCTFAADVNADLAKTMDDRRIAAEQERDALRAVVAQGDDLRACFELDNGTWVGQTGSWSPSMAMGAYDAARAALDHVSPEKKP